MNLKIGDSVIVKPSVQDPDLGINLGGWQGRISEISEDDTIICIDWDSLTLQNIPDSVIAQCEEEGLEWGQMYLDATEVKLTTARDTEADVAQITHQIQAGHTWDNLGEEGKRIQQILGDVDPEDEWAILEAWEAHLSEVLKFPFEAEVAEFQEKGRFRVGDQVMVQEITDIDDLYGLLVEIKFKREVRVFPLCDLKAKDPKSSNYDPVHAYAVWFANR
jgi:Calcium binding